MCGICGELRFNGRPADLAAVQRMTARLERRGPDHGGAYADGALGFGHRRLAIIDLSEKSNQPLVDQELGLALVFNGTVYNYRELRAELRGRGYHFFSEGDSEVILKAYREWGEACPEHLHGMFAFAVWDMRQRTLFLARDRFGIKPCYYTRDGARFRFASSTQALLAGGGVDKAIDPVALHFQFTLHGVVPAPWTVLTGVRKLEPAHSLTVGADGRESMRRYWDLDASRPARPLDDGEWIEAIHGALREAVQRRNDVADVPVGRPAVRWARLQPAGRAAGRGGRPRSAHVLRRLRGPARGEGQRVRVFRPGRRPLRHAAPPIPGAERRRAEAAARGRRRHGRADVRAGRRRLLPALRARVARDQGRAVGPGRGRGIRRLLLVSADAGRGARQPARPFPAPLFRSGRR